MIIFIESFEFKFENEKTFDCYFLIFHFRLRWAFNIRFVREDVFMQENVFVATMISIFESFCSKTIDLLQQLFFESNSCFEFDLSKSSFTIKNERSILKRDRIVYWDFIETICSTSIFFDNMTSRRQLTTSYRRFDSRTFKRLIWTISLDMLSWWLHLNDLNINLSYVIFNMISCLFIHDLFKIIEWLFKSIINMRVVSSKCKFIVNLKYMTCVIDEIWRSSNSIKDFDFNNDTDFMLNMLHTSCAIFRSMKAYSMTSISIKVFNLCWLSSKNSVQLMIKNLLLKELNMLSSWIKKIRKHSSIASSTWITRFSSQTR